MGANKTQRRTRSAGDAGEAERTIRKLLRQNPLPLAELQRVIASDARLVSLVLRAAEAERPFAPGLEGAIVLLGAEGIRAALAKSWAKRHKLPPRRQRRRGAGSAWIDAELPPAAAERMRVLRAALASNAYRVHPKDLAAAMLRELERG